MYSNYAEMLKKPYYDNLLAELGEIITDSELTKESMLSLMVIAYNKGASDGIEAFKKSMNGDY